jgi:hypothetical protein
MVVPGNRAGHGTATGEYGALTFEQPGCSSDHSRSTFAREVDVAVFAMAPTPPGAAEVKVADVIFR